MTATAMTATAGIALYYGTAQRPLANIVPDRRWPDMWRIARPDGHLSDMLNLTRAKDAAALIAERGPPERDHRRFHWRTAPLGQPLGSRTVRRATISTHRDESADLLELM